MVPQYNLVSASTLGYIRRIPIPGLDALLGVTAYQIAEAARAAALAATRGSVLTKRLARALERRLSKVWKTKEVIEEHSVEITREVARGAMHVVDEKPVPVEELVGPVTSGVVEASSQAGVDPLDSIRGVSQGIIQGAVETGLDLSEAVEQTLEAARKIAAETGISSEEALIQAVEGVLLAAEEIGPEATAEVVEGISEEILELDKRG
jgi:hypothetical protein